MQDAQMHVLSVCEINHTDADSDHTATISCTSVVECKSPPGAVRGENGKHFRDLGASVKVHCVI